MVRVSLLSSQKPEKAGETEDSLRVSRFSIEQAVSKRKANTSASGAFCRMLAENSSQSQFQ